MNFINIGTDVGGKWGDGRDIPVECMVARNRYVATQPHMINQFWHAYEHCVRHRIRQIIGLDWWQPSGRYYPPREKIISITRQIKNRLQSDGIGKELASFENDNEPAKYNVAPQVHSWQANEIQAVLGDDYDCYAGSEEVSYRSWYQSLNTIARGYSFHLQNCALNPTATDSSVNFMANLAAQKGKLLTCSEGNYQNPQHESTWNNVRYHIEACRRVGARDYCVIFLELRDHSNYQWLAWRFNGAKKRYYDSYINLIKEEKKKKEDPMADQKNYNIPALIKKFAQEIGLDLQPNYNPYLPVLTSLFFQNDNHYHRPDQSISKADFDAFLERFLNFLIKKLGHSKALNLYYDGQGKWRPASEREAITKSNPK